MFDNDSISTFCVRLLSYKYISTGLEKHLKCTVHPNDYAYRSRFIIFWSVVPFTNMD